MVDESRRSGARRSSSGCRRAGTTGAWCATVWKPTTEASPRTTIPEQVRCPPRDDAIDEYAQQQRQGERGHLDDHGRENEDAASAGRFSDEEAPEVRPGSDLGLVPAPQRTRSLALEGQRDAGELLAENDRQGIALAIPEAGSTTQTPRRSLSLVDDEVVEAPVQDRACESGSLQLLELRGGQPRPRSPKRRLGRHEVACRADAAARRVRLPRAPPGACSESGTVTKQAASAAPTAATARVVPPGREAQDFALAASLPPAPQRLLAEQPFVRHGPRSYPSPGGAPRASREDGACMLRRT